MSLAQLMRERQRGAGTAGAPAAKRPRLAAPASDAGSAAEPPKLAKLLTDGRYECKICKTPVQSDAWTTHTQSRPHVQKVLALKRKVEESKQQPVAATKQTQQQQPTAAAAQPKQRALIVEEEEDEEQEEQRGEAPDAEMAPVAAESATEAAADDDTAATPVPAAAASKPTSRLPAGFFDDNTSSAAAPAAAGSAASSSPPPSPPPPAVTTMAAPVPDNANVPAGFFDAPTVTQTLTIRRDYTKELEAFDKMIDDTMKQAREEEKRIRLQILKSRLVEEEVEQKNIVSAVDDIKSKKEELTKQLRQNRAAKRKAQSSDDDEEEAEAFDPSALFDWRSKRV